MPRKKKEDGTERIEALEYEVRMLRESVNDWKQQSRSLVNKLETRVRREKEIRRILEVDSRNKKGAETVIHAMMTRMDELEDYLLTNTKRIENVLSGLKTHREYLIKLNKKAFTVTPRELMKAELGVMNNTLGILSLNGIKVSQGLLKDIRKLEEDLDSDESKFSDLQKRKNEVEVRFNEEVGKHDIEKIFSKKKEIYGYR
ncbi:MAG TPA: hypothetical protein ENN76_00555 [Euryarchaeota archaeon]|nr:hypothetical protein [Euryarchaeota archaeon]